MNSRSREIEALTDALLDDLMNATDNDILEEANQDGTDLDSAISLVRTSFNKARFQAAKDHLMSTKSNDMHLFDANKVLSISDAKKKVIAAIIANPEFNNEFTLAARSGNGIPDDDVAGIYEDLVELGLIYNDK